MTEKRKLTEGKLIRQGGITGEVTGPEQAVVTLPDGTTFTLAARQVYDLDDVLSSLVTYDYS